MSTKFFMRLKDKNKKHFLDFRFPAKFCRHNFDQKFLMHCCPIIRFKNQPQVQLSKFKYFRYPAKIVSHRFDQEIKSLKKVTYFDRTCDYNIFQEVESLNNGKILSISWISGDRILKWDFRPPDHSFVLLKNVTFDLLKFDLMIIPHIKVSSFVSFVLNWAD